MATALVRQLPAERFLHARHVHFETATHDKAETALSEADAVGVPARYVIKSLVLGVDGGFALAVLPASRMLDMNLMRKAAGTHDVRLATEKEISRTFPQFELGAIPPLPDLLGIPGYVDPSVLTLDEAIFADGRRTESMVASPREVYWGERVFVLPISRPAEWRLEGDAVDLG